MSAGTFAHDLSDRQKSGKAKPHSSPSSVAQAGPNVDVDQLLFVVGRREAKGLSQWSQSAAKRFFDCMCVLTLLPLLLPVLITVAVGVFLTSAGPVLFLQKRVGAGGRNFTILKFRTIVHDSEARYHAVSTADNQPFTPIGRFLRRWKLDELPQVFNVLLGHMSLVGPRPKMPEHVTADLCCRPGITGAATIAFACEEIILDRIPKHNLNAYYHQVILPAKQHLDAEYMACATFRSDLNLILKSVLRQWDGSIADALVECERLETENPECSIHVSVEEAIRINSATAESISFRTGTM